MILMDIDNYSRQDSDTIILYPRLYNKRGEVRLHSVQGVMPDGTEVNIKLRVDEGLMGNDGTPTIAEFAREDVKAKFPCIATETNGPDAREGVLLFTGCQPDGESKKGLPSYTARWAYVLSSHSDSPEPAIGIGRIVVVKDPYPIRTLYSEIDILKKDKPVGWEALVANKEREIQSPINFSFYAQIYHVHSQQEIPADDQQAVIQYADDIFVSLRAHAATSGLLIRLERSDGSIVSDFCEEVFPKWSSTSEYQSAESVFGWFFKVHQEALAQEPGLRMLLTPIVRFPAGPSFKNYYFLNKPDDSMRKIERYFWVGGKPSVSQVAFTFHKKEIGGDLYLNKFYPLSGGTSSTLYLGREAPDAGHHHILDVRDHMVMMALQPLPRNMLPSWYTTQEADNQVVSHHQEKLAQEGPEEADSKDLSPAGDTDTNRGEEQLSEELGAQDDESPEDDLSDLFSGEDEQEEPLAEPTPESSDNEPTPLPDTPEADDDSEDDFSITDISTDRPLTTDQVEPARVDEQREGLPKDNESGETVREYQAYEAEAEPEPEPEPEPVKATGMERFLKNRGLL